MKTIWAPIALVALAGPAVAVELAKAPAPMTFPLEEAATLAPAQVLGQTPLGRVAPPAKDRPTYFWAAPRFNAPSGRYGRLNDAIFVSHVGPAGHRDPPAVRMTIWKVGA